MNTELWIWIWVGVGCLPWWVSRRVVTVGAGRRRCLLRLEVRAIFWRLVVEQPPQGRVAWRLRVPLIERRRRRCGRRCRGCCARWWGTAVTHSHLFVAIVRAWRAAGTRLSR